MTDNRSLNMALRLKSKSSNSALGLPMVLFVVMGAAYLVIINILGKVGLDQSGQNTLVIVFTIAGCLFAAYATRTLGQSGLLMFANAGGNISAINNGLAGAAEWLSLFFVVGIISSLTQTNHQGLALLAGAFLGMAILAIFIMPRLAIDHTGSPTKAFFGTQFQARKGAGILRLVIALVVILCAMAFLIAQTGAGAQIINLHFPMSRYLAASILLAPILVVLLAGGMRGLTLGNMLLFWVISAAIILPTVWLSLRITSNPIPQLGFGTGALQPILELEQQLLQSPGKEAIQNFEQGNFTPLAGYADFFITIICMMTGTAALPMIYTRVSCSSTKTVRIRSLGTMLIFSALLLSLMPAFVTFMKFEIYRDIIGLPIRELGENTSWLFNWSALEGGHHALICSKPAVDLPSIIAACGKGGEHVLIPSDLQFSPLMTFLGAGEIADMPVVYSAIAYIGVLSAAITTAGISLMVIINTVNSEIVFSNSANIKSGENPGAATTFAPVSRQLFFSRVLIILVAASAIWISQIVPVPVMDFTLWAIAISAGGLFPLLVMRIWWSKTTPMGALAGIISGVTSTLYLLITIEYGKDWIAQNGDEPLWLIPFTNERLSAMNTGVVGLVIAIVTIVIVSTLDHLIMRMWQSRRVKKQMDA